MEIRVVPIVETLQQAVRRVMVALQFNSEDSRGHAQLSPSAHVTASVAMCGTAYCFAYLFGGKNNRLLLLLVGRRSGARSDPGRHMRVGFLNDQQGRRSCCAPFARRRRRRACVLPAHFLRAIPPRGRDEPRGEPRVAEVVSRYVARACVRRN